MVLEVAHDQLRVKHVGQFGLHAAAKNAGVKPGDIVAQFDGRAFTTESELLRHALTVRKVGDKVPVELIRDNKTVKVILPMQE
jgi:S1-C subfamily serine protease